MEKASDAEILKDVSRPALAAAVKSNLYAFFIAAGKSRVGEISALDGLRRWSTRVPYAWFNGVLARQAPGPGAAVDIQQCVAYFKERGCDVFTWWLEPGLASESWQAALAQQGFGFSNDTPGMALDLASLPDELRLPQDVSIRPVESLSDLRRWVKLFVAGYGAPKAWSPPFYELLKAVGIRLPIRHYLGSLEGREVSASTLWLASGVAGIYDVATLPEARGRGLGSAITLAPLLEARRLGYRAGVLQSTEEGFGVYRRLGFEQVCTLEHFYWRA